DGDDLRGLLASLPREQEKKAQMIASKAAPGRAITGAFFVLGTILLNVSLTATARAAQAPTTRSATEALDRSARDVRTQKLRKALDQESQRAIYRWHDAEHPSPPTWFDKLLAKIGHAIERAWNAFWNFLRRLLPRGLNLSPGNGNGGWQLKDLRLWLTLMVILTLAAVRYFIGCDGGANRSHFPFRWKSQRFLI